MSLSRLVYGERCRLIPDIGGFEMSKYDDALPRIEQALDNYAATLHKNISARDVITEAEQIAISKRGQFPSMA